MTKQHQMLPLSPQKLSQAEAGIAISCYISKKRRLRDGSVCARDDQLGLSCTKALARWLRRQTEGPSHLWFSHAFCLCQFLQKLSPS